MAIDARVKYLLAIGVLLTSVTLFCLGVSFPVLSNHIEVFGFGFSKEEINLFDSVVLFYESKDYFVALIILLFTFVLPAAKYIELTVRLITRRKAKPKINLDKWNMLDVFLVALLLLNFKMNSSLIVMELQIGTLFIALAVLTRMASIELIDRLRE